MANKSKRVKIENDGPRDFYLLVGNNIVADAEVTQCPNRRWKAHVTVVNSRTDLTVWGDYGATLKTLRGEVVKVVAAVTQANV